VRLLCVGIAQNRRVTADEERVVKSLLVYGFSPAARVGDRVYGTNTSAAAYYNLTTGANGYLPSIPDLGPNYFVQVFWAQPRRTNKPYSDGETPPYAPYATTFTALAVSPDGSALYGTDSTAIYVLDSRHGRAGAGVSAAGVPILLSGRDGALTRRTTLFLTNSLTNVVYPIDTATGQITQAPVGSFPSSIAVLP
jgi:hypothetical protein